jgi:hypothetical protein
MDMEEMNRMDPTKISHSALDLALVNAVEHLVVAVSETNKHLAKIANPLMVFNQPRWVWFKYNAFRYVVDAREVASISVPDPNHCVIIMRNEGGPDPGRFCEGSYEEVCTKLGIPTEEGK